MSGTAHGMVAWLGQVIVTSWGAGAFPSVARRSCQSPESGRSQWYWRVPFAFWLVANRSAPAGFGEVASPSVWVALRTLPSSEAPSMVVCAALPTQAAMSSGRAAAST
ncbi:hypothetical protein [Sinomonas atrocyanea]